MADDFGPFNSGDNGTAALIHHWKRLRDQQFAAATASASGRSFVVGVGEALRVIDVPNAELTLTGHVPTVIVSLPEMLIGAALVEKGTRTDEGDIVVAVTPVFRRFLRELDRDPNALYHLDPRQFEELIAGAYEEAGCENVVLTPRSGDKGRDVIATSTDFGTIRILDQVKLYSPHRVVEPDDVRALYGVLSLDQGASKGIITTTSRFAPSVYDEFKLLIPGRISLRNVSAVARLASLVRQAVIPQLSWLSRGCHLNSRPCSRTRTASALLQAEPKPTANHRVTVNSGSRESTLIARFWRIFP